MGDSDSNYALDYALVRVILSLAQATAVNEILNEKNIKLEI